MKKTRILFLGVVTSIALCSFLTSCDQVQVKQTETITIEKQRNQHLIMLSSAQAQDLNILILPEAYTKDEMGDFVADASKLYSVLRYTSPYYYLMDKTHADSLFCIVCVSHFFSVFVELSILFSLHYTRVRKRVICVVRICGSSSG